MPMILIALLSLFLTTGDPFASTPQHSILVRGTVIDSATSKPLPGTRVSTRNGDTSSQTDASGSYTLRVTVADSATRLTLIARRLGYNAFERTLAIAGDSLVADFRLSASRAVLQDIVVTSAAEKSVQSSSPLTMGAVAGNGAIRMRGGGAVATARPDRNTEEYARIEDNRFLAVRSAPLSTFSVDVDRASYTNVRRFIRSGELPPKDAVRLEELVNYFPYRYDAPNRTSPFSISTEVADAPWSPRHRIVRIGLQTARIETAKLPPSNLVFLLDVSGSMMPANKLPLVKQAFRLLVNELREEDRVAIVVYAGQAGLVLPSTSAADKQTILDAIERLEAGGSTAGGAGIRLAYDVAKQNFLPRGNNRVIWATDGDFNVGVSNTADLVRLVEERRAEGTALTLLGFGMGNLKDSRMEQLADKGNGNYAYIDDLLEARKVFVQEIGATLLTVAKDVKLQVEFNPATVQAYRLIGYENRLLRNEDFTDDHKDAGDMGAGHSVTALYEIVPVGVELDVDVGTTPAMRYQRVVPVTKRSRSSELLSVNVRYKPPTDSVSRLLQHPVFDSRTSASDDLRFALAVAGYGMLLRDSPFKGRLTYDDVLALARESVGEDAEHYRADFVKLVEETKVVAARLASSGSR